MKAKVRLLEKKLTNIIIAICFMKTKKHIISMSIIAVVDLGLFTVFKTKTWRNTRNNVREISQA